MDSMNRSLMDSIDKENESPLNNTPTKPIMFGLNLHKI